MPDEGPDLAQVPTSFFLKAKLHLITRRATSGLFWRRKGHDGKGGHGLHFTFGSFR